MQNNYTIRPITKNDFNSIIKITDTELGKDYITPIFLENILSNKTSLSALVLTNEREVLGYSIFDIIDFDKTTEICKGFKIDELEPKKQIGYIKTVAVKNEFKGLGLGTLLVNKSLELLKTKGIQAFFSTAWKHGNITNIAGILSKQGFEKKLEIKNYWYEQSIKEPFVCPFCNGPCTCSSVIYIKIK